MYGFLRIGIYSVACVCEFVLGNTVHRFGDLYNGIYSVARVCNFVLGNTVHRLAVDNETFRLLPVKMSRQFFLANRHKLWAKFQNLQKMYKMKKWISLEIKERENHKEEL